MMAAAFYHRPPLQTANLIEPERFIILVPAHNEALTLPASLTAIKKLSGDQTTPTPLVVVVADNCTDNTAELARQAGTLVYERHDTELRGKGYALQWAIKRLLDEYDSSQFNALVIFDADTIPDPDFLRQMQRTLRSQTKRGATPVVLQGRYDVLEPRTSWRTLLLFAAFVIYNHIRPLGRAALGLSDGLRGNGMVFRREILEGLPWQAFSLVEDIEYTTRLALNGSKVTYVPEAKIYGQAAATGQQAGSQRMRWEGGRWAQARQDVPRLMRRAVTKADPVAFDRAVDLVIPPLALLVIGLVAFTLLDTVLWWWLGGTLLTVSLIGWLALLVGMVLFVLGGLIVGRAPLHAYLALAFAPVYILWKLGLYLKMLYQRSVPQEWVRTQRTKIESPAEILDTQAEIKG
jgi:1,2-diacylglycerol 3-beta-glucosyltransferase